MFKNEIIPNDASGTDQVCTELWLNLGEETRFHIREAFGNILGNSQDVNQLKIASMCIAIVARVELPEGGWPDFMETMSKCATDTSTDTNTFYNRYSALSTLGFLSDFMKRQPLS